MIKVDRKNMRDVNVGEQKRHGMRVKDLKRKKRECGERGKHMNRFKV